MEMTTETPVPRRLYKSRRNRMIDGICGGIAEYFEADPTLVRILWVLITLLGGSGFILYIVAMIIMPVNPEHNGFAQTATSPLSPPSSDRKRFWGIVLIILGAFILVTNLGLFAAFHWWHFSWDVIFPITLIILGLWFIYVYARKPQVVPTSAQGAFEQQSTASTYQQPRELRRSRTDKKLFGVCGGLAKYFNIDPTIVRVLYVILVLASFGWGLLLYLILTILMKEETPSTT